METNKKNTANAGNEEKNKNVTGSNSGLGNADDAIEDDGTPVLDEEAAGAGELVGLARQHPDRELFVGKVGPGQLVSLGLLGLVDVDGRG